MGTSAEEKFYGGDKRRAIDKNKKRASAEGDTPRGVASKRN